VISILLSTVALGATLDGPVDLKQLADDSSSVVRGVVVEAHTLSERGDLHTVYTVAVEELLTGEADAEVVVTLPGGTWAGMTQRFAGVPTWSEGDEVVVFVPKAGVVRYAGLFTVDDHVLVNHLADRADVPRSVDALVEMLLTD